MHRHAFGLVADLLALDHEEAARLLDKLAEPIERLQANLEFGRAGRAAGFDPLVAEAFEIFFERFFAAALRRSRHASSSACLR